MDLKILILILLFYSILKHDKIGLKKLVLF